MTFLLSRLQGTNGHVALSAKCVEKYSNADCDNTKKIKYGEKQGNILEQFRCIPERRSNPGEANPVSSSLGELSFSGDNLWSFD